MLNNILVILWIILIIYIFYFWKKKPNKKYKWVSIVAFVAITCLIGSLPENKSQTHHEQTTKFSSISSSSSHSSSLQSNSSSKKQAKQNKEKQSPKRNKIQKIWLKHKAGKLKLGTSKSDVEKKLGKPDQDDGQIVLYDNFELYFENNKLVGGDLPALQNKFDRKRKKDKESRKNYNMRLQSFAQSFGRKPVDTIQSMPSTYVTEEDGNGNTIYGWHPEGLPELVRVDSGNNNTDVYLYDEHGENKMLGKHLYHGRTIYQKQNNYNNGYDY